MSWEWSLGWTNVPRQRSWEEGFPTPPRWPRNHHYHQRVGTRRTYKYQRYYEGDGIQHAPIKEKIRKEYYTRIRLILRSELNSGNRFQAIYTLAVPVITYSFNINNCKVTEIRRLDVRTRTLLTMAKMHHPKADVDRLYLPRKDGGRCSVLITLATSLWSLVTLLILWNIVKRLHDVKILVLCESRIVLDL